jgi:hypothetical protein
MITSGHDIAAQELQSILLGVESWWMLLGAEGRKRMLAHVVRR